MRRRALGAAVFLAASTVIGSELTRSGINDAAANPAPLVFSTYFGGNSTDVASAVAVDAGGNTYVTGWTASTNLPVRNAFQSHSGGGVDAFVVKFDPAGARVYCTYLGGDGDDRAYGIAVDAAGSVYLTGWTSSTDFPTAGTPYQQSLAGGLDAFVARLSATGDSLIFSTLLGGGSSDQGRAIALDASGNAFVAGQTASSDFPTLAPLQTGLKGPQDAFVAEVDGYGALLFSTYLGGSGTDTAAAIAVGGDGCLYLTGATGSLDFPTLNALQPVNAGSQDAFVTKLSPGGAAIVFSTYLGGSGGSVDYPEAGLAIDVDAAGNAYVAGVTSSPDFPTRNALQPALAGWVDAFVAKVDATGTVLDFSTYLGGSGLDYGVALRVDSSGAACVAGYSTSPDFPLSNPVQSGLAGSYDAFLSCLTASGQPLTFSTLLGGSNSDAAYGLAMDANSVYVAGLSASGDFPLKNPSQNLNTSGKIGAFVTRLTRYQEPLPSAVSVTTPSPGGNQFVFQYSDTGGYQSLDWVQGLFQGSLNGVGACWIQYSRAANQLFLVNDAGTQAQGGLMLGVAGTVQNSQCSIDAGASSASGSGNNLTLSLAIAFKAGFAGTKNIYLYAHDIGGADTGWRQKGALVVGGGTPSAVSYSSPGAGTYVFTYGDTAGYQSLVLAHALIQSSLNGANACWVAYSPAANQFYLVNDAGTQVLGALQNSQCSLNAEASSASGSGNNLTLTLAIAFQAGFVGAKNVYLSAQDVGGASTGWQQKGSLTLGGGTPSAVSYSSPGAGTYVFTYGDTGGYQSLDWGQGLFQSSLNGVGACWIQYSRAANQLFLINDAGTLAQGGLTLGVAGTLQNSQCSIDAGASSASGSGNTLTLSLAIAFKAGFVGTKNIYLYAHDISGADTGWQLEGSRTLP